MLINKSHPHPVTKKAPAGGKIIVTRMTITSEVLTAMSCEYGVLKVLCGAVSARLGVVKLLWRLRKSPQLVTRARDRLIPKGNGTAHCRPTRLFAPTKIEVLRLARLRYCLIHRVSRSSPRASKLVGLLRKNPIHQ